MRLRVQEVKRSHYVYTETGVATKNRVVYVDHYARERYAAGKGKFKKPKAQIIKERGTKIHIGGFVVWVFEQCSTYLKGNGWNTNKTRCYNVGDAIMYCE
jgi:hypothetical protein